MIQRIGVQSLRQNTTRRLRLARWAHASCLLALYCGRVAGQEQQDPPLDEVAISSARQSQLENEALTLSGTPYSGPHLNHTSAVLGLGALISPVYPGAKKTKVDAFPYVDIRGLLNDRVFISDVGGIGVKILNDGPVRAGVSVTYGGGRTSHDDPRLKGLPDIKGAAHVTGYVALALNPIILEATVRVRAGSKTGTDAGLGASYNFAPLPPLHLSFSADIGWANAADQNLVFGITPANAAAASAQGNPLPAYTARAGLNTATVVAAGVYQLSRHWGVIGRFSLSDLIGSSTRNSPLTERTFALSSFALGMAYSF